MPQTKTRVVGSGFTTFNYRGQPVAYLDGFTDTGQRPVGRGFEDIHPIDTRFPKEIVTARALGPGTLILTIRELWNEPIWHQLVGLAGTHNLLDVWDALALDPAAVTCQMLIKPPGQPTWRGKTYHNCVVLDISDDENVAIGLLSMPRQLTVGYTHYTPLTQPAAVG